MSVPKKLKPKTLWAGVDGCPIGWALALVSSRGSVVSLEVRTTSGWVIERTRRRPTTLVDIPIGLPSTRKAEPRRCDIEARKALAGRASSVFPAPSREAVWYATYRAACRANVEVLDKKLSMQTWRICPKIREADGLFRERLALQGRVREAHPEVCWVYLTGRAGRAGPLEHPKSRPAGLGERREILRGFCRNLRESLEYIKADRVLSLAGEDDWLDAIALALTARDVGNRRLRALPARPEADEFGIAWRYWVYPDSSGRATRGPAGTTLLHWIKAG